VESGLTSTALLPMLQAIEADEGRVRDDADRNAPRPLDIDILYEDAALIRTDAAIVPHPRWFERRFVVQPLADVRPDLAFPPDGLTPRQALLALPPEPKVVAFCREW
jgi:2-amino-4-hydroxy-6-hydroxymethyldihydropteridine diphosphokinase